MLRSIVQTVRPLSFALRSSFSLRTIGSLSASFQLTDEAIFSDEHESMRSSLRKLIDQHINPYVDEWEEAKAFPAHQVFKKLGDAGFLGVSKPTEYGGLGLDFSFSAAVAEEFGHITCGAIPMAIGVQADMATPALARFGSDEMKRQFLAPSISGDLVACLGVSEAGAGSDVASIKTTARPSTTSDDLVINGGKMWTTSGAQADWMCLLASTRDGDPHRNKSLICLPMNTKGVTISRKIDKLGNWASDTVEVAFEDVRVPKSHIIGEEGKGFQYQMMQFQEERMCATALMLEPMQRLIEQTVDYTRNRKAFGRSILDNQVVHFRIAELQSELEALRSLHYRCIGMYVAGKDVTPLASMAKLKAGRLVREVTDSLLQYWGGMGYTSEVEVSRQYRDSRLLSIGAGADEVMLSIICKWMGTLPRHS
ncbi:probable acyl-CoA dehydrogenase 6 [Corticium candelabrum]|uniref:probable acyl-CoA dehydrogenase 6 n=1 Tax=Corticium candelabrum TaxID=121492 RepID=UPI002E364FC5|nr:probable acyl-CoA dehydrogenase 6 [Corticium candelabrum]